MPFATAVPAILIVWAMMTLFVWVDIHFDKNYLWGEKLLPCIVFFGTVLLFLKNKVPRSFSGTSLLGILFFGTIFYFNLNTFIIPWMLQKNFTTLSVSILWQSNIFFIKNLLSILFVYGLVISSSLLLGLILYQNLQFLSQQERFLPRYPLALLLGLFVGSWIVVFLASIDSLTQPIILGGIIVLHCWKLPILRKTWKDFTLSQFIPRQTTYRLVFLPILFLLIVVNMAEVVRPAPTGYDDSTLYYDRVQHLAQDMYYPTTYLPLPFEYLAASISIATNESHQMFALALATFSFFLGAYFFWLLCRKFFDQMSSLLGVSLFLSIPMFSALTFFESKPDMLMLAHFLMALYTLTGYWQSKKQSFLFLSAFLLGSAATIKLTALFFAPGWILVTLLVEKNSRSYILHKIQTIFLVTIFIGLPLMPWLGKYSVEKFRLTEEYRHTLQNQLELFVLPLHCQNTGSREDYSRFGHLKEVSFPGIFSLPWQFTMNTRVNVFATEVGFAFLALLPFGLLFLSSLRRYSWAWFLGTIIISGSFLWGLFGKQILWYILPVWPLLLLTILFIRRKLKSTSPKLFLFVTIIALISILGSTLTRLKFAGLNNQRQFIIKEQTIAAYLEASQPGFIKATNILNNDLSQKIYLTNTRFWYGIENNTERAFMDNHLDTLACLLRSHGASETAKIFRLLDIHYILFNKSLLIEAKRSDTYAQKMEIFTDFLAKYSRPVWGSSYHMIFELTPRREHPLP